MNSFWRQNNIPTKELSKETLKNAHKVFYKDEDNPPFLFLKQKHSHYIDKYSKIADIINCAAMGTTKQFEEDSSIIVNDYVVHYFFDLYLALNSSIIHQDLSIASCIVDGIHFRYYGQPSQNVITSPMQLWAEKETCFLMSFFTILKERDFPRLLAIFAYSCISDDGIGSTEGLKLSEIILNLIKIVSPKIETKILETLR